MLDPRRLDGDARTFGLGYLLLLPLYLTPLFVARYLPGLDLPFHLSMVDMLNKEAQPASPYREFYAGALSWAPYAAHYVALRLLSLAVPLIKAHKLIVGAYVATLPLGSAALLNACGRSRVPALLAFPLAYNLTLHYGFVGFAISLPVLVILLAVLARFLLAPSTRPGLWIEVALLAALLFLCHLQNFLFGLCACLAFVLLAGVPWRRRAWAVLALLPSIGGLLLWHARRDFEGADAGVRKSLGYLLEALRTERMIDFNDRPPLAELWDRLHGISVHALRGFTDWSDVIACRGLLVVLAGYITIAVVAMRAPEGTQPAPRLRGAGVVVAAGALLAYLGLPHHLPELELMTLYPRFSVLVLLFALLLIPGSLRRLDGVGRPLVMMPAFALAALYGQQLIRHYRDYDREVADFAAVAEATPPGGRALGLVFDRQSRVMRIESALVGLPSLYPVLHPSPTAMAPLFYCGMRHMPCRHVAGDQLVPDPGPWNPGSLDARKAIDFFDYFFLREPPNRPLFGLALDELKIVAQAGSWIVYGHKTPVADRSARAVP